MKRGRGSAEPLWLRQHPSVEAPAFRLGRDGDHFIAEWVGLGVLRARLGGGSSEFIAADGVPREVVERLLAGTAGAFARHARGELTLHASAVAVGDRAIAFVGDSGAGKSTLAAHLCARHGASLVADDLLFLDIDSEGVLVTPSARANRLLGDARGSLGLPAEGDEKREVDAHRARTGPARVAAIVLLAYAADAEGPALLPLRGPRAFVALSESLFRLALDESSVQRRDFDRIADVAARVPMFALARPRSLAAIEASCTELLALIPCREPEERQVHS